MLERMFESEMLWFSLPALLGSGVFLIRLALILLGGDSGDGDFADVDIDVDVDSGDHASGEAFEVLSIQSVSVFLMGFGWVGLGCVLGTGWSTGIGIIGGFFGGMLMLWILARTLGAMRQLESSGNVSIQETLGLEGEVYAEIPAHSEGKGQVQLIVRSHQRMYNAVSRTAPITTRTRVRVTAVNTDNTLTVEAV